MPTTAAKVCAIFRFNAVSADVAVRVHVADRVTVTVNVVVLNVIVDRVNVVTNTAVRVNVVLNVIVDRVNVVTIIVHTNTNVAIISIGRIHTFISFSVNYFYRCT